MKSRKQNLELEATNNYIFGIIETCVNTFLVYNEHHGIRIRQPDTGHQEIIDNLIELIENIFQQKIPKRKLRITNPRTSIKELMDIPIVKNGQNPQNNEAAEISLNISPIDATLQFKLIRTSNVNFKIAAVRVKEYKED